MIKIDITGDLRPLQKKLTEFQKKQVPFATALALTRLAQGVRDVERAEIEKTFDAPTPFTLNSITIKPAKPNDLRSVVYPKDIAAHYLEPYVVGGKRSLGGKVGMIVPKSVGTNQYGNLTKNKLKTLKAKPGVFIGTIKFKRSGQVVSGVWQRGATPRGKRYKGDGDRGTRGNSQNVIGGVRTTLKLLLRFEDTTEVPRRIPFEQAARTYLNANTQREFKKALAQAMATAKR